MTQIGSISPFWMRPRYRRNDFNYGILEEVHHRPWPMPARPWVMTQTWHDLLFAHWPVDVAHLHGRFPKELEIDLFDGQAWVGIVPFSMANVAPRGFPPLPVLSAFPELNVRTYVRVFDKPGVYFFSLDTTSLLTVIGARVAFHLPYYLAAMHVETGGGAIHYRSHRRATVRAGHARFAATYRPAGPVFQAQPGTLEYFLSERYCLYTQDRGRRTFRGDIHHPPWPLQPASVEIEENSLAEAAGLTLPAIAPLLHFSKRQDVVAWAISRVDCR